MINNPIANGLDNFKAIINSGEFGKKKSFDFIDAMGRKLKPQNGINDILIPGFTHACPMDVYVDIEEYLNTTLKLDLNQLFLDQKCCVFGNKRISHESLSPKHSFALPLEQLKSKNHNDSIEWFEAFRVLLDLHKGDPLPKNIMNRFLGDHELVATWKLTLSAIKWWESLEKEEKIKFGVDFNFAEESLFFWKNSLMFPDLWHNLKSQIGKLIGATGEVKKWSVIFKRIYWLWLQDINKGKNLPRNYSRSESKPYPSEINFTFTHKLQLLQAVNHLITKEGYREKLNNLCLFNSDEFQEEMEDEEKAINGRIYKGGRFLIYETLFCHVVPSCLKQIDLLCQSDKEENVMSLLFFILINNMIIGNPNYLKTTVSLINTLLYEKKNQPELFNFHLKNLKFLQNVSIEYIHSILGKHVEKTGKISADGINELIRTMNDIRDARSFSEHWMGHKFEKTYSLDSKCKNSIR